MLFRSEWLPATALLCTALVTASLLSKPGAAANPVGMDPPVLVTNLSGDRVELQWQTVQPSAALSPLRGTSVPVDAIEAFADEGLFWFYDPADGGAVKNVVFVSIVDADGTILSQVVMEAEISGTLEAVEETVLHITIETDGELTLSIQDAD